MKVSSALNGTANLAVILVVAVFLWRSTRAQETTAQGQPDRLIPVDITGEEWESLVGVGARLGAAGARPVVVEFMDYACTHCASTQKQLDRLLRTYPAIAIVVRHYPLVAGSISEGAARVSVCAEAQGQFEATHNRLFATVNRMEGQTWQDVAREAGIKDLEGFQRCLSSPETDARLELDRTLAVDLGIHAVPMFVSRKAMHAGSVDPFTLNSLVDIEQR